MSGFVAFVTSFCVSCIFIGALTIISPEKAMSKPVKYVLSLVFIVSVIGSASLLSKNDISFNHYSAESASTESMSVEAAKFVYSYTLKQNKINFREITVCTDKLDDGSIIITKVIIYSDANESDIRSALGAVAQNYEVEIKNE